MDTEYTPKILLVDDIKENLLTLEGNLRSFSIDFYSVQNGREAIALAKQHDFALIILDVQMPGIYGYETAEAIRQSERNKHTPIIFLTAVYSDQASVFKGFQPGAVDYITKPFNREILVSKVSVFLELDQARHELAKTKKEFQSIVQDQTDLLLRTDKDNLIIFANRAFLIATTKTFESIKGDFFIDWISEKDRQQIIQTLKVLTPSNAIVKIHHTLQVSDLLQKKVSTEIRARYDSENELTGYQYVMRDISKEVVTHEELILAKQKAEEATKSKSQFLANMSHELRTPLHSMLGMIDLLMETNLDEDQLEDAGVIKYSATKLLEILNNILDFSKIETNQIHIQSIWFDISEELNKIVKLFGIKANGKGNNLSLKIMPDVPKKIKGDPLRVGQIIMNLLDNAIKFTENGSVQLMVEKTSSSNNKINLKFTISDTGIGIPEAVRTSLFNFYQQGNSSVTREYEGAGLGLAISKSLCELMGGAINFESEIGKGSTFWFTIGFEQEIINVPKKIHILVVEDNLLNQKIVGATLQKNNFTFDIAENGRIAVEKVKETFYNLILMDIQMPVMDGYEATRQIREFENNSPNRIKSQIIALTANVTKDDREQCEKIGMNGYLTKPFIFANLKETLLNFNSGF